MTMIGKQNVGALRKKVTLSIRDTVMQKAGYSSVENIIGSCAVLYAEGCAEPHADVRAVHCAVVRAEVRADSVQNWVQPRRGDLCIVGAVQSLLVAPAERPVHLVYRSLRWSYSNRWLRIIYTQVALPELKRRAEIRAECCAVWFAETLAVSCADDYAAHCADLDAVCYADACAVVHAEQFAETCGTE